MNKLLTICIVAALMLGVSSVASATLVAPNSVTVEASKDGETWFTPVICHHYKEDEKAYWRITLNWNDYQEIDVAAIPDFAFDLPNPLSISMDDSKYLWYQSAVYVKASTGFNWYVYWDNIPDANSEAFIVKPFTILDWNQSALQHGSDSGPNYTIWKGLKVGICHDSGTSEKFKGLRLQMIKVDDGHYVPEPATICLLGLGYLGLLRRRKRA